MAFDEMVLHCCPLFNLPPELRHRIFYLCLLPSSPSTPATIKTAARTYLSLQLTSRLVNTETHVLPFQNIPLALPCNFGTNATALLSSLRKMKQWQIHAIRAAEVSVLGSVYDAEEAGRVVRLLRDGVEDSRDRWNRIGLSPDVAIVFGEGGRWGEEQQGKEKEDGRIGSGSGSELRELSLTITARDVMAPMADSGVGMEKILDLEKSPFFVELTKSVAEGKFRMLRKVAVNVELGPSLKGAYPKEEVTDWEAKLWSKLNLARHDEGVGDSPGDGKRDSDTQHARMEVKVHAIFKPSPLTFAAEYFTALGGDGGWWVGNTSATMGLTGTASTTWGGVGVAMMSLSAPAGRPS